MNLLNTIKDTFNFIKSKWFGASAQLPSYEDMSTACTRLKDGLGAVAVMAKENAEVAAKYTYAKGLDVYEKGFNCRRQREVAQPNAEANEATPLRRSARLAAKNR